MTFEECWRERKLRRTRPDLLKARKSLEVAEEKLWEAEKLAKAGFESTALVTAYSSMFHCGRALLFKDGVVEKSHYCLIQYLKENYVKTGKIGGGVVTMMDSFREERHDVLYSLEGITIKASECKAAVEVARRLFEAVKSLLK